MILMNKSTNTKVNVLVGADPELFARKANVLISAHNMIRGTKENPFPVEGGALQVDGMALEFNITPAKTYVEFKDNISKVLKALKRQLPKDVELAIIPVALFGASYIAAQPSEATELGCTPDYDAYNGGKANVKPSASVPFRTASGHLHIGWGDAMHISDLDYKESCIALTRVLDLYLGIPSIVMDTDTKRRKLYGKAGAFRYKSYGLEYRVLSNFWLVKPEKIKWAYASVIAAMDKFINGFSLTQNEAEEIRDVINTSNTLKANQLIKKYKLTLA